MEGEDLLPKKQNQGILMVLCLSEEKKNTTATETEEQGRPRAFAAGFGVHVMLWQCSHVASLETFAVPSKLKVLLGANP